jgi:hypothetical protein
LIISRIYVYSAFVLLDVNLGGEIWSLYLVFGLTQPPLLSHITELDFSIT